MKQTLVTLKNDLDVLFIDSPGTISCVQIWFKAGSALENRDNMGIAHFLEHMFFKGTPTRPGAKIAHDVESFGGDLNAFTSFDYTCYYINAPIVKQQESVEILMDMISNPMFKEEDLYPERNVVFEEFRRSIDSPNQYAFAKMQKSAFTKGYAHQILGTEKSIKNFTVDQLRAFRSKNYNSANSLLVIAGDMKNREKLIKTIEGFDFPKGKVVNKFSDFTIKKGSTASVHSKEVRMSQLSFCTKAKEYLDSKAAREDLAVNCLGNGETSRLHRSLVLDKALANGAYGSTMYFSKGGAHFFKVIFPHENFNKVLKVIHSTFLDILKSGFKLEEVKKIKNQYIASKIYEKESLESFAFSLGHGYAQTGDINCEEQFIEKIDKCSMQDVNSSVKDIFNNDFHFELQIPKGEDEDRALTVLNEFKDKILSLSIIDKNKKVSVQKGRERKSNVVSSKFDSSVNVTELKSGVKLLYRQNKITPTFIFHSYIKGGLSYETKKNNGIYNLVSNMLLQGYRNVTEETIKDDMESRSASISSFSGKNAYGITFHGQSIHAKFLMNHYFNSLLSPNILGKKLVLEKKLILRSLDSQIEDPARQCFLEFGKMIFGNHPYSFDNLGSIENVKNLGRHELLDLHNSNLKRREILFTYCGDKDKEEVLELISPYVDRLASRNSKKRISKKIIAGRRNYKFIEFDREQTHIFIGVKGPNLNSRENLILKMVTQHLSGQSSELFVDVRDRKGLCYTASPVFFTAVDGGFWGIYMASGHDKTEEAIKAIEVIIAKLKEKGFSKSEFERVKKMIAGQSLLNVQTNEDYANIYSIPVLHDLGLDYFHTNNEIINTLSYKDFQKGVKKILAQKWLSVVVGQKY